MTIWSQSIMEINSSGLASLLRHNIANTLIVDCRCFADFNSSHVKNAINAFYSKLMRRRLIENKVDRKVLLDQLAGATCREFADKMDVVLYGEDQDKTPRSCIKRRIASCNAPENPAKILRVLRDQLEETGRFNRILILEGGFHGFQSSFPQLCEGSCEGMNRLQPSLSQPCLSQPQADGPTQILPFLYLGSQQDALDSEVMKKCGISFVVNLSIGCPRASTIVNDENFMRIPINDSYEEKLSPYFEKAWQFLENVRSTNQVVLIHCLAGISRSATLAISYVMRHKKLSSDDAYKFVKEKRPTISPNFNFMGQLLEYEQHLIKNNILTPDVSSKRCEKPLTTKQEEEKSSLCPAKIPKSASAHCVFFDPICDMKTSIRLNENGKRNLEFAAKDTPVPNRPRALGLLKPRSRCSALPEELPSPSSELSKLTFGAQELPSPASEFPTSLVNPCFVSPTSPPESSHAVKDEGCSKNNSYFNRFSNFFKKTPHMPRSYTVNTLHNTSRPECLHSSGIQLKPRKGTVKTSPVLTEEDAESPESGYQFQDEYKTSPEEADRVSLNSQSSVEIAVQ